MSEKIKGTKVSVSDLSAKFEEIANKYGIAVHKGVEDIARKKSEELNKSIKADAPTLSGKYKRAMAIREEKRGLASSFTWYVKEPHYRKAHLLENGHNICRPKGVVIGHVNAKKHIEKNEEKIIQDFEKETIEFLTKL